MWIRRTRLTLAIALLLSIVILAWLAGHPRVYSGHVGRLVTRHVLSDLGLSFACSDIAGNPMRELRFYDVVMTRDGRDDDFAYLSCDSLDVRYEINSFFSNHIIIPELTLHGPRLSVRRGQTVESSGVSLPTRSKAQVALRLDIGRLRVHRGEVDVQHPRLEEQQNFRAIQVESRLQIAGEDADFWIDEFRARWSEGPYRDIRLAGRLSKEARTLEFEDGVVQLDSLQVQAKAQLQLARGDADAMRWRAELDARELDLGRLLAVIGKPLPIDLRVEGRATLASEDDGVRIDGAGRGNLAWFDFDLSRFDALLHGEGIEFVRAEGVFQKTTVRAAGRLDTHSKLLQLGGSARGFDLSQRWSEDSEGWPTTRIDGDFHLELGLDENNELDLEVSRGRGELHDIQVDSLRARLNILPERGVRVQSARGIYNGSRISVEGEIGADGLADLDFDAEARDAAPWLRERFPEWQGRRIQASGNVVGALDSLQLAVSGTVGSASGPQLLGNGIRYDLHWPDLRRPESLNGELELADFQLREWRLGRAELHFRKSGDRIEFSHLQVARGDSSLSAGGRIRVAAATSDLTLDSLRVDLGELSWWLPEQRRLQVGSRSIATDEFELRGARGSVQLDGVADLDGALDLRVRLDETDLSLLRWARLSPFDCAGVLNGTLELEGSAEQPRMLARFELREAQLREHRADSLRVSIRGEDGTLWLSELELHDRRGHLRAAARAELSRGDWLTAFLERPASFLEHWPQAELEATVSTHDVAIDSWLPEDATDATKSYGRLRSRLDIFGTARRPRVVGELTVTDLRNSALEIPELRAEIEADSTGVRFERGSIAAGANWLEFSGAWPLLLSASQKPLTLDDDGLNLALRSREAFDLAPLATIFPAIELAEGSGRIEFLAVGDPRAPRLSGEIQIDGTRLRLRDLSEEFRELTIRGNFHDGLLEITEARAREGEKGRVEGRAEIRFDGLKPDDIVASAQVHRLLLLSVPELRAIVSSQGPLQLSLRRPAPTSPRVPHVTGRLTIDRARYNGEFAVGDGGGGSVLQATSTPPWTADLSIALRDQIRITNSVAELLINGDVDLTRDLSGLRLRGVAEIASGRVSVARLLDFEITEGRLDFSRGSNMEPIIQITAETDVPVYSNQGRELEHVTVRVSGTFAQPQLAFSSQSGYDEKTIINLLAGIPVDEGAEGARLQALALRMAGKELTGALADAIGGIDTIDLSTTEAGDAEGTTRIGLGKYLDVADKPLYLRYTQGLSVSERDIYLEYQLRRRFLLTFEVRRRLREAVAHTELNADLKFRVEY